MNSEGMAIFCPLEGEIVDVEETCEECTLWDGEVCAAHSASLLSVRSSIRRLSSRLWRGARVPRRRGRGLRIPPVWEKWPEQESAEEPTLGPVAQTDYAEGGSAEDDESHFEPVPEPWEQEAHVPDECEGVEQMLETAVEQIEIETELPQPEPGSLPEPEHPPQFAPPNPYMEPFPSVPESGPPGRPPGVPGPEEPRVGC